MQGHSHTSLIMKGIKTGRHMVQTYHHHSPKLPTVIHRLQTWTPDRMCPRFIVDRQTRIIADWPVRIRRTRDVITIHEVIGTVLKPCAPTASIRRRKLAVKFRRDDGCILQELDSVFQRFWSVSLTVRPFVRWFVRSGTTPRRDVDRAVQARANAPVRAGLSRPRHP